MKPCLGHSRSFSGIFPSRTDAVDGVSTIRKHEIVLGMVLGHVFSKYFHHFRKYAEWNCPPFSGSFPGFVGTGRKYKVSLFQIHPGFSQIQDLSPSHP